MYNQHSIALKLFFLLKLKERKSITETVDFKKWLKPFLGILCISWKQGGLFLQKMKSLLCSQVTVFSAGKIFEIWKKEKKGNVGGIFYSLFSEKDQYLK